MISPARVVRSIGLMEAEDPGMSPLLQRSVLQGLSTKTNVTLTLGTKGEGTRVPARNTSITVVPLS